MDDLTEQIRELVMRRVELMREPRVNRRELRILRRQIQAMQEGARDVLTTYAAAAKISMGEVVDKNNYATYSAQVEGAYKMYDGLTDYGTEVLAPVADTRVAFIAGEGVSIASKNKKKLEFLQEFLRHNNLNGSTLLQAVQMGEFEGKVLFVLAKSKDEEHIDARLFSWYTNKYKVERDKRDPKTVTRITYQPEGATKPVDVPLDKSMYVKLGGSMMKDDCATTRLGKCLTQCENASRAAYDLRHNTHLFGRVTPTWETKTPQDASAINNELQSRSYNIGTGFAGTAKMGLLEPSGSASEAVIKDMLNSLRFVASMTSVPIHWLAWPELMSNRATAENMLEVVSAGTKKERLLWQESLTELFNKVCVLAVDQGIAENVVVGEPGDIDVRLPLISLAAVQQLVDVWLQVFNADLISKFTMRNMLPGIDPEEEEKLIDDEREEAAKRSPFNNVNVNQQTDEDEDGDVNQQLNEDANKQGQQPQDQSKDQKQEGQ